MNALLLQRGLYPAEFLQDTVNYILSLQQPDGCIPWFKGHYADPWDHVESAMALSISGEYQAAERAYQWLADEQLSDGSWWAEYWVDGAKQDRRETNFVAYVACGVWQHYLLTTDDVFLRQLWPTVRAAISFVLGQQTASGEINWAVDAQGQPVHDALLTGCSSIYKSLECAHNIAVTLGEDQPNWLTARQRLGQAIRQKPDCFDRNWSSKSRYSMDWFYPILSGVLTPAEGRQRIEQRWDEFVEEGLGCRCVSDEPWVAVAESCELTMALLAVGEHAKAVKIYSGLHRFKHDNGGYWTGYVFADDAIWPEELTSWTAAAIILAADALTENSAASDLFTKVNLLDSAVADVAQQPA